MYIFIIIHTPNKSSAADGSNTKKFEKSKLMLDFLKNDGIINLVHDFGELCNGSTTDSDSVCWGSNPYSPAIFVSQYGTHRKGAVARDSFALATAPFISFQENIFIASANTAPSPS